MIVSEHAQQEMQASGISKEEIIACLENGELEYQKVIHGEMRYLRRIDFKDKTIMVAYTYRESEIRVITCYNHNRKKWQ
ncbi:DUF4258 domain-containing protein [Candidatus Woesearchaeota archaeon]|nr:DUF4258 domain-containing protein [Candidatus Woesearchaeota archaeon]